LIKIRGKKCLGWNRSQSPGGFSPQTDGQKMRESAPFNCEKTRDAKMNKMHKSEREREKSSERLQSSDLCNRRDPQDARVAWSAGGGG
jgi:hypothetical protein